jgi:hypothetical protein
MLAVDHEVLHGVRHVIGREPVVRRRAAGEIQMRLEELAGAPIMSEPVASRLAG